MYLRLVNERRLVCINRWPLPHKIGLKRLDKLRPLEKLPECECEECEDKHGVVDEPVLHPYDEILHIARVAICADDDGHPNQADPGTVWLEPPIVWKRLPIESLGLASTVEEDVRDAHDNVVDDTAGCDQVDQPAEDHG